MEKKTTKLIFKPNKTEKKTDDQNLPSFYVWHDHGLQCDSVQRCT